MTTARNRPHRLDAVSESPPLASPPPNTIVLLPTLAATSPSKCPVQYWDIYVDDFLSLVQGNKWHRRAVKRILLQSLDRVFRPLDDNDVPDRQEPASLKKLRKGDGAWTTQKTMPGWQIDTADRTITLPPHRIDRLRDILAHIRPGQKYVPTKQRHKLLG